MKGFVGIDTSAYTTSVALVDQRGELVADKREVLKVELGKRGLRQSEALFAHIKNLPFLFNEMQQAVDRICQAVKKKEKFLIFLLIYNKKSLRFFRLMMI